MLLLLITLKRLVTTSNGTILTFWPCKVNKTLFIQELQPALTDVIVSSGKLLSKAIFINSLYRQFPFETRSKISTADVFWLGSRPQLLWYKWLFKKF